ncbi:MAG: hypothetical protein NC394_08875 [Bacteroides sp.]|nr:hypothetical protein [Bacteroides sp.]
MTVKEIEALAKKGTPLSDKATLAESLFYYNLRALYREYGDGLIDKARARVEKTRLVNRFGVQKLWEDCGQEQYERWRRFLRLVSEAEKNGCEYCRRIIRTLDGRER